MSILKWILSEISALGFELRHEVNPDNIGAPFSDILKILKKEGKFNDFIKNRLFLIYFGQ